MRRTRSAVSVSFALLAGCCFTGGSAPSASAGPLGTACAGHWTGAGTQPGFPPWPIDLTVTPSAGDQCGTIEYPSLGCGGILRGCGTLASGESTFTEYYTHTTAECAPPGAIRATCAGTTMTWTWEGQGPTVTTTLTRM